MKCVKCDGELIRVTIDGTRVDQCPKCFGIWFDFGELEEVLEAEHLETLRHAEAENKDYDALAAPCPRCGGKGKMVPVKQIGRDFHIDTCTVCYGKWLDGGELDKLREKNAFSSLRILCGHLFDDVG